MIVKSRSIVLHTVCCATGQMLARLFTEKRGMVTISLPSHRGKRGGGGHNLFQPFALLSVEMEYRENKEVQRIASAEIIAPSHAIASHPVKLALALFMAELVVKSIRQAEQDERLFLFILRSIELLEQMDTPGLANFHLQFMASLTSFLGFYPDTEGRFDYFDITNGCFVASPPFHSNYSKGDDVRLFRELLNTPFTTMAKLELSRNERNRLLDLLISYYRQHLHPFPTLKSVDVLRMLFT